MNGVFGSKDLIGGVSQSIFCCSAEGGSVVSLNVCNRGSFPTYIDVAVSESMNSPLASEWIEYGVEILPKGVLERTGITITQGQYLTVRSYRSNVNAMCWGVSTGSDVDVPTILVNTTSVAPTWVSPTDLSFVLQNESSQIQVLATAPSNVTYSLTSGSLPTGLSLDTTTGALAGIPTSGSYSASGIASAFTISASNATLDTTTKIFNIVKKWRDGSTSQQAASSATAIKNLTGTNANDIYWLNHGSGPYRAFCYMSAGGYILVAKIGATPNNNTGWSYNGSYWFSTSTLNEEDCQNINNNGDAIGRGYYEFTPTTGFLFSLGNYTNTLTVSRAGTTARNAFTGSQYNMDSMSRAQFMTWINNAGTASSNWDNQPNCNRVGFNRTDSASAAMRFGITMNNEADCNSNDSAIGFGTYTNSDTGGLRNIPAGGHRWNGDQKFPHQGFIFVK